MIELFARNALASSTLVSLGYVGLFLQPHLMTFVGVRSLAATVANHSRCDSPKFSKPCVAVTRKAELRAKAAHGFIEARLVGASELPLLICH